MKRRYRSWTELEIKTKRKEDTRKDGWFVFWIRFSHFFLRPDVLAGCSDHLYFLPLQVILRFFHTLAKRDNARSERCKRGKPFPVPRAAKREKIKAKPGKKANCIFRTAKTLWAMVCHAWRPFEGHFPFLLYWHCNSVSAPVSSTPFSPERISFFWGVS